MQPLCPTNDNMIRLVKRSADQGKIKQIDGMARVSTHFWNEDSPIVPRDVGLGLNHSEPSPLTQTTPAVPHAAVSS